MAKSVRSQKKRVTHIGKLTNSNIKSDDGNLLSECFDYVHNIMQEMDSSIKSVGCNKSDQRFQEIKNLNVQKNNETQITNSSSSDLQNFKASNLKKYSIPRKYPLMEKSQKILKQLKHNRSIPKQRAHLASFEDSLMRKNNECETAVLSKKKAKSSFKVKEKATVKKSVGKKTRNQSSFEDQCSKYISKTAESNTISPSLSKQNLLLKATETSNSYLSDSTTDSEYERFVEKNKMPLRKKALKTQKKSKKTLKTNKTISTSKKIKSQNKLSDLEEYSKNGPLHGDSDFSDYSSDSDDNNIYKRKVSHLLMGAKSNTVKNKQLEINLNPVYDESKTSKKRMLRNRKVSKEKLQNIEENLDTGSSLQSWPEQYDSNFHDDSSESHSENTHKRRKVSLVSMKMSARDDDEMGKNSEVSDDKEISISNIEAESNNLLCGQESEIFPPGHSSLKEKENFVQYESSQIVANNPSDVLFPSNLVFCSKSNELDSKDASPEAVVTVNDTLHSLSQNQVETKSNECHLGISRLPSSSTKFSESSIENSTVITLSSESDTEAETISVSEKNSWEVVMKTQSTPLCSSYEEPDLEIIEEVSPKKNIPSYRKVINNSENLSVEDSRSLYTQDRIKHSKHHLIEEITKCSQTADEANYLPKTFPNNASESTLTKEEMKKIITLCNVTHVKQEKVSKNTYSATYSTNICNEFNKNEIVPKISELLKSSDSDGTPHIFESAYHKSIASASSIINYVSSSASTRSVKHQKNHNNIIVIDSEGSNAETLQNGLEEETLDDDIIIIDSFVKTEYKDISKINSSYNSLQNENIFSSIKSENLGNAIENYVEHCTDIPKLLNSDNSTSLLKTDVKTECPASAKDLQVVNMQENATMVEKELFCQDNSSDVKGPTENALHLLEIFKKEFKTYQEILRTEKNVQAGLKFVEAHQAQKLNYLRSKIQNLLKDSSDFKINSNCMTIKEQQDNLAQDCVILNNPESPALNKFQHPIVSCNEDFSKSDCLIVQDSHMNRNPQNVSQSCTPVYDSLAVKKEPNNEPVTWCLDEQIALQVQNPHLSCKSESNFIDKSSDIGKDILQSSLCVKSEEKTLNLLDKKCNVCGRDAVAACQKCAKAFFCSHKCGKKFWTDGHEKICGQ